MSKQQIIEQIQRTNPSAGTEFLAEFAQAALESYLRRLRDIYGRRGAGSVWVREGDTPAIVTRVS